MSSATREVKLYGLSVRSMSTRADLMLSCVCWKTAVFAQIHFTALQFVIIGVDSSGMVLLPVT